MNFLNKISYKSLQISLLNSISFSFDVLPGFGKKLINILLLVLLYSCLVILFLFIFLFFIRSFLYTRIWNVLFRTRLLQNLFRRCVPFTIHGLSYSWFCMFLCFILIFARFRNFLNLASIFEIVLVLFVHFFLF